MPLIVKKEFDIRYKRPVKKTGTPQRFGSAVLVRGTIGG
jgi:hypothetical protein